MLNDEEIIEHHDGLLRWMEERKNQLNTSKKMLKKINEIVNLFETNGSIPNSALSLQKTMLDRCEHLNNYLIYVQKKLKKYTNTKAYKNMVLKREQVNE
jgi:hypothetical protein